MRETTRLRKYSALFAVGLIVVALLGAATARATEITRVVSPGGIEAWLVHEPSIPMIAVEIVWEGAARLDPPGKAGLANMVSGLLDEGAGTLSSEAFQARLADRAIRLSFNAGMDTFEGNLITLSEHREEAFDLLRLAITAPRFDAEPVERVRRQIVSRLKSRERDADWLAGRAWYSTAFPDHPYGVSRDGTVETVSAITGDDLKRFVKRRLARDNMTIGVVGDVTGEELGRLLDRTFGDLPAVADDGDIGDVEIADGPIVKVIEHDSPQSVVIFGLPGIKRDDPDYYAAYVMNYILGGGGLNSRLNEAVRERRGLTYSIYSYLNPMIKTGLWMGGLSSGNETVAQAIELTWREIERLRDNGVTAEELADAKTYLNGSFPLRLTSNSRIAGILVALQRFDLGIDYIDRRDELINAVTLDDIKRVAKRLLNPDDMIVVVVGKPDGLAKGG